MKCELCNLEVSDIKFLNRHMANMHKGIDRKLYKYHQSEEYKVKKRRERHDKLSKRMKEHNPMHNKEVRDRTSKTLKDRYADGTIKSIMEKTIGYIKVLEL